MSPVTVSRSTDTHLEIHADYASLARCDICSSRPHRGLYMAMRLITSRWSATYVRRQRGTARIRPTHAAAAAIGRRYLLPAGPRTANLRVCWCGLILEQTDRRTPYRFLNPALHTMLWHWQLQRRGWTARRPVQVHGLLAQWVASYCFWSSSLWRWYWRSSGVATASKRDNEDSASSPVRTMLYRTLVSARDRHTQVSASLPRDRTFAPPLSRISTPRKLPLWISICLRRIWFRGYGYNIDVRVSVELGFKVRI